VHLNPHADTTSLSLVELLDESAQVERELLAVCYASEHNEVSAMVEPDPI
jgi:hypothetical protein